MTETLIVKEVVVDPEWWIGSGMLLDRPVSLLRINDPAHGWRTYVLPMGSCARMADGFRAQDAIERGEVPEPIGHAGR